MREKTCRAFGRSGCSSSPGSLASVPGRSRTWLIPPHWQHHHNSGHRTQGLAVRERSEKKKWTKILPPQVPQLSRDCSRTQAGSSHLGKHFADCLPEMLSWEKAASAPSCWEVPFSPLFFIFANNAATALGWKGKGRNYLTAERKVQPSGLLGCTSLKYISAAPLKPAFGFLSLFSSGPKFQM